MFKKKKYLPIFRNYRKNFTNIYKHGVLELFKKGYGFLRSINNSYVSSNNDIYVSHNIIKQFKLRTGDSITGKINYDVKKGLFPALSEIKEINGEKPKFKKKNIFFENLTPLHTNKKLIMEQGNGLISDLTSRILDLASPIGRGQRGLIVAPPKAGKTMLLQNIAQSIVHNHPDCFLIVLLIDERPEEVTEMLRLVKGEIIASTFDEPASRHIYISEMVLEKAKRLVEQKNDVIILLDSITRLARAYNSIAPVSGKILTGGIDSKALHKPKRFFGTARNVEEGGSLTIIATALINTGSKMDEVIYEEFKGTGNMELHLSRRISDKRVFPAINYNRSGTRKEELLTTIEELKKMWILRKIVNMMDETDAIEFLSKRLSMTKTNKEFFNIMEKKNI
ncbi:MAG: transcription termination factor Rho [Enterobacteriaceae bacterium PSpicST2]|nr:MAG: transcription termination factor Rho [Enterobacteriaceae bacterium PSpicST2]WMC19122.1 MAG: transcription termination factor Rho [Enterobacteriaceae bacterium PSpicST1]